MANYEVEHKHSGTIGSSVSVSFTGMGFITWLVFLILKVTNAWPALTWFWVWFPLWIPWAAGIGLFIIIVIIGIIAACILNRTDE